MKRTLSAILAAAAVTLGLTVGGGAANAAAAKPVHAQFSQNVNIAEVATRGVFPHFQFVKICNTGIFPEHIGGLQLFATFSDPQSPVPLTAEPIPEGTVLQPGEAYLVANILSRLKARQYFSVDIPDSTGIGLLDMTGAIPDPVAEPVSAIGTTEATVLKEGRATTPQTLASAPLKRKSITHSNLTDFVKSAPPTPFTCQSF
jgi:hypothetical protein